MREIDCKRNYMPTIHCKKCKLNTSCGNLHLYVIEFKSEVEKEFERKSDKGYLYVGSTGKSVDERFNDNFIKKDESGSIIVKMLKELKIF